MTYNPRDHFFKKAKKENFVARSVYKLEEIDKKFKIFKNGDQVLDLGASPGSWSQYVSPKIGDSGFLLGIDLQPVKIQLKNGVFIEADLRDLNLDEVFKTHDLKPEFNSVISDMAPKTTGIRVTDQARSAELCELSILVADRFLKRKGHFICKLFHSDDFQSLKKMILQRYDKFEAVKPEATRAISKEIFLVGLSKK